MVSTPPPPPAPPPPNPTPPPPVLPAILSAGTTSQEFASKGATYGSVLPLSDPRTSDGDQLTLRYDAQTNSYEVRLPQSQAWAAIAPVAGAPGTWSTADSSTRLVTQGGGSSALLSWQSPKSFGVTAVGIPAPVSSVAVHSRGVYNGTLAGFSTETINGRPGTVDGTINLSFGVISGSLTGSISPTLTLDQVYGLPTLNFTETVFSRSSVTFSGKFDTGLSGSNGFSGMFAGSTADQMIGSFVFPYLSPVGGNLHQAGGAFTARERPLPQP